MITTLLIMIYLSFISIGFPNALLGSAWPSMYGEMAVPVSYMGMISMIIMGCTAISSAFCSKIFKRFETGVVAVISILMLSVALLGFAVSGRFIFLCICAVPLGLGVGFAEAVFNNYAAIYFKARHMNWIHCFWGVGASIGPVVMAYGLTHTGSWRSGYYYICIFQFILVAALLFALPLWKKVAKMTVPVVKPHEVSITEPHEAPATEPHEVSVKFSELFRLRGIKHTMMAFFCYSAIETTVGLWGSSYLVIAKDLAPALAAKWIALFFFGITFGRFFSGILSIKLDHRQMMRLGYMLFTVGIAIMLLPLGDISCPVGFFLMGLGCAPVFPTLLHVTPIHFGKAHSQAIMGLQIAIASIGSTIMPALFGMIASYIGYGFFWGFLGIFLVGMVTMIEMLNSRMRGKECP